jgi:uncharacterized protein (TIGR03435 family)
MEEEIAVRGQYRMVIHGSILMDPACPKDEVNMRGVPHWKGDKRAVAAIRSLAKKEQFQSFDVVIRGIFRVAHEGQCFRQNCLPYEIEETELLYTKVAEAKSPSNPVYPPTGLGCAAQSKDSTAPILKAYDVASIKQNRSGRPEIFFNFVPSGFIARNVRLRQVIELAYQVEDNQISGAPNWINSQAFDIEAKMDSSIAHELSQLGEEPRMQENRSMLQSLLADRFKLRVHREAKELPTYALVIAKNGPKVHEAKPGDAYSDGVKDNGHPMGAGLWLNGNELTGQGVRMADLARELTGDLGRTVVDQTELTGRYDFTLKWSAFESQPPGATHDATDAASASTDSEPPIFTAIQEQLGLRLISRRGQVRILVIDHVERPSPN